MKSFYLILFLLIFSCEKKKSKEISFTYKSPESDKVVYQKIEIFDIEQKEERVGKKKYIQYFIHLTNSKKDTIILESNIRFHKGIYWSETIERDGKIITILNTEIYETIKLN